MRATRISGRARRWYPTHVDLGISSSIVTKVTFGCEDGQQVGIRLGHPQFLDGARQRQLLDVQFLCGAGEVEFSGSS